jgi:hypothetical protein
MKPFVSSSVSVITAEAERALAHLARLLRRRMALVPCLAIFALARPAIDMKASPQVESLARGRTVLTGAQDASRAGMIVVWQIIALLVLSLGTALFGAVGAFDGITRMVHSRSYGVDACVERCLAGRVQIPVDGTASLGHSHEIAPK